MFPCDGVSAKLISRRVLDFQKGTLFDTVLETRENFSHKASSLLKLGREITNSTLNSLVPSHPRTEKTNLREELAKLGG